MNFAKILFKTVDLVFDLPQNPITLEAQLADVECEKDIHYSAQYPEMALDLYYYPHEGKYPVIFEIHGGGFSAGDKKYRRCFCRYLAKHTGALVVNANYGVGEQSACPVPMQQLVQAVNWVAVNGKNYNADLSHFVVTGDSAGAFYACFLAVLQHSEVLQDLFECKPMVNITATVLNCGIYNMELAMTKKMVLAKGVSRELMGVDLEEAKNSKYFEGLILTNFVTADFPQTLLIYSQNDLFVKGQGECLQEVFEQQGVSAECVCAQSVVDNHVYSLTWITSMAKQTNEQILQFLNNHFGNTNAKDNDCK